jgi:hypothetical protein
LYCFFIYISFIVFFVACFWGIIGGGSMLLMSLIGRIFYKKDVWGSSDVSCFRLRLLVGTNGAIFAL